MKRKTLLVATILIVVLILSCVLVACGEKEEYTGPDFSIEVLNADTSIGTITQDNVKKLTTTTCVMDTKNDEGTATKITYTGYALIDIINDADITLPTITNVTEFCTDGYGGAKSTLDATNLDNVFLAISGVYEDGTVAKVDEFPTLLVDKTNSSSKYKLKNNNKIVVNFVA
ncbi:MAG: hypothetical protein WCR54_00550 [Clostridia bacterium]